MAAGLGFKTFTTGEVLTAADTNGYLMQGVLVFASSAARAAAITSPQEGQYSYLKDTNSTEYYDGAAWIAAPIGDITGVTAGTGISGGGTSGTVTVTNSMATEITAAGDIIVGTGSGTFDNLPIGTTAQVLTADTTVSPYKVKWATPATAASGLTLIKRASFSGVATTGTTFDNVFTSSYTNYLVMVEGWFNSGGSANDDPQIQFMYSGSTQATGYFGGSWGIAYSSATLRTVLTNNATQMNIWDSSGASDGASNNLNFYVSNVGNGSDNPIIWGGGINMYQNEQFSIGNNATVARAYTGLLFKCSAANTSGTVTIYGLANA